MNEDTQKQFVGWLAQKLKAKDEQDLKVKLQSLGNDGIKEAYQAFVQEQQQTTQATSEDTVGDAPAGVVSQATGGKLEHIKCLQAFKRGGAVEMQKCGCVGAGKSGMIINGKQDKKPGLKDWMDYGKKKKEHTAKTKVPKAQQGGVMTQGSKPHAAKSLFMTEHSDGTYGPWGYDLKDFADTRAYGLARSNTSDFKQLPLAHYDHLRKVVPSFDKLVGNPMGKPGYQQGFGPEQSDIIRKLALKYPLQAPQATAPVPASTPTPNNMASMKTGGKAEKKEYIKAASKGAKIDPGMATSTLKVPLKKMCKPYMEEGGKMKARKEAKSPIWQHSEQKETGPDQHKGGRKDSKEQQQKSARKDHFNQTLSKAARKDKGTDGNQRSKIMQSGGPIGDGANKFKTSKQAKKLTPNKVAMGQGAGTVTSR